MLSTAGTAFLSGYCGTLPGPLRLRVVIQLGKRSPSRLWHSMKGSPAGTIAVQEYPHLYGDKFVMTDCNGTKSSGATRHLAILSCFITERLLPSRIMGGICPYQQLRCILHSPGLPRLTWPRRLASPRLARFGLIAHALAANTHLFSNACCAHFFYCYQQLSTLVVHIPPPKTRA